MAFYTVENFKLCLGIFEKYMFDVYNVPTSQFDATELLYAEMRRAREEGAQGSLRELNNMVLNRLKQAALAHLHIARPHNKQQQHAAAAAPALRRSQQPLDRDKLLYGQRPLAHGGRDKLMPTNTSLAAEKHIVERSFEQLMQERSSSSADAAAAAAKTLDLPAIHDAPLGAHEIEERMSVMEQARAATAAAAADPKQFFEKLSMGEPTKQDREDQDRQSEALQSIGMIDLKADATAGMNTRQDHVIAQTGVHTELVKYITVNGYDRDLKSYKARFSFPVSVEGYRFRNITCIQFTKLILPAEVRRSGSRPLFQSNYCLSFPYVMLCVQGLQDVYLGSNPAITRSTCMFVYDKTFTASNGRSYTLLTPMQGEAKRFCPTPLSALPRMHFSVEKPNGTLVNDTVDDYTLYQLEYALYNRLLIKVVTHKYFDANDFAAGDMVRFHDYRLVLPEGPSAVSQSVLDTFNAFMGRPEGHEVAAVGVANANGMYRVFYIPAPGVLNHTTGSVDVDEGLLGALFPDAVNGTPVQLPDAQTFIEEEGQEVSPTPNMSVDQSSARIINMSLQATIAMKVTMTEQDAAAALRNIAQAP